MPASIDAPGIKVASSSSRPDQAICPVFVWADELDVSDKAKCVELAFVGLEATSKLACDVRRMHLAGLPQ